jgi:tetratricopeptide (TPR) repeat protein
MFRSFGALGLLFIGLLSVWPAAAQQTPLGEHAPMAAPRSLAEGQQPGEAYVIKKYSTDARFESDGTGEVTVRALLRIENEAGAQKFRDFQFRYRSGYQQMLIRAVTIGRANGSRVDVLASPDALHQQVSALTADAPAYRGIEEMHVLVPSLQAGDLLGYEVVTRNIKPLAHGEFWFEHRFMRDAIVLDEELSINLPAERAVSIRSPGFVRLAGKPDAASGRSAGGFAFSMSKEDGRAILRWKHANLSVAEESQQPSPAAAIPADVQLTSLASWTAVAQWYLETDGPRASPTPELSRQTQQLIRGAGNDMDKMRAIYSFVAQKVRSVNLPLSLDLLPRLSPAEVLANGYADAQDKNRLLMAMLEAAGIRSCPALLPYAHKLDTELPSPAQLDHVLTAVPESGQTIWIDATSPVAPFRFLPAPLRDKSALLVSDRGTARLGVTPTDPPFASLQQVEIEGQISELGQLAGTIHYFLRGDTEFVLRTAFHQASRDEWNQLAETILTLDGLHAEVTSVETSGPLDTETPFELTIAFSDPDALLWPVSKARLLMPLVTIALPDLPADGRQPVELGTPLEVHTRLELLFPANLSAQPPVGVSVSRDYAEFGSSYRFENGTLSAERTLNFKMRSLPATRGPDYVAFTRAVSGDQAQALLVANTSADPAAIPPGTTADDLFEAGAADLKAGHTQGAILLFRRVTEIQPQHKEAWNELGLAYMQARKFEEAAQAFRKQAQVNPSDQRANDYLGVALQRLNRPDEAAVAFRRQIEVEPLDTIAHAELGDLLLADRHYPEAVPELEKAVILSPDNPQLQINLGQAYLAIGESAKALAAFQNGVALSPTPPLWSQVAYSLADSGTDLDRAQQYASSAVAATEEALATVDLDHAKPSDFAHVESLAAYWDILGWVYFKRGDPETALRYVRAAWLVGGRGEYGNHLAEIYEKLGQKERAIETYALALAASQPVPESRVRLMLLLGGNAQIDGLVSKARPEFQEARRFRLPRVLKGAAAADFLILISSRADRYPGPPTVRVRFLSGSESLRLVADRLQPLDYGELLPESSRAKILMRGTLSCSPASDGCAFQLRLPEDAAAN